MAAQPSRRQKLQDLKITHTHAGLWLDKYMTAIQEAGPTGGHEGTDPRQLLVEDAALIAVPSIYGEFFARWQETLAGLGATCRRARALGRLAIGLGNESVIETAITLHRTYGVPYLPGSALKGLASSFASQRLGPDWQEDSKAYLTVFGSTSQAGYITFFDAYPESSKSQLLYPDIMAIHHPDYYQGQGAPPVDWDDPSLVPFPTATGSYLVALAGPKAPWADAWVDTTFQILGFALQEMGIGAKTASGYGRMVLERPQGCAEGTLPGAAVGGAAGAETQPPLAPQEGYALAKKRLLGEDPPAGRQRGTVRDVRGTYGFIAGSRGGGEIFVHQNDLRSGQGSLRRDQVVEFTLVSEAGKNKTKAADVVVLLQAPG